MVGDSHCIDIETEDSDDDGNANGENNVDEDGLSLHLWDEIVLTCPWNSPSRLTDSF